MRPPLFARLLVPLVLIAGAAAVATAAEDAAEHRFKITLTTESTTKSDYVGEVKMNASGAVEYTWRKRGNTAELVAHSMRMKLSQGDTEIINIGMSRAGIRRVEKGKTIETALLDADKKSRALLAGLFETPLCTLTLDQFGEEIGRQITAKGPQVEKAAAGMIATARVFHIGLPEEQQWESPCRLPIGEGGLYSGKLRYSLVRPDGQKTAEANLVTAEVSGLLTEADVPAGREVERVRVEVTGNQTYDKKLREWTSGKLEAKFSIELSKDAKPAGTLSGITTLTLENPPPAPARK